MIARILDYLLRARGEVAIPRDEWETYVAVSDALDDPDFGGIIVTSDGRWLSSISADGRIYPTAREAIINSKRKRY